MSIIILSIISFILAFMPFFKTLIASIFIAVCTIILAFIYNKKIKETKTRKQTEIAAIAVIISVIAIIGGIINFTLSLEYDNAPADFMEMRIKSFDEYDATNEVTVEGKLKISVKNVSFDGNDCLIDLKLIGLTHMDVSKTDFYVYNAKNSEIVFASDSINNNISYSSVIEKDEVLEDVLKFKLESVQNVDELYLIYKDNDNSVKIKI